MTRARNRHGMGTVAIEVLAGRLNSSILQDDLGFDPATVTLTDRDIRRYLAAKRWRDNHVIDRGTYDDPTWRTVLRDLGSWTPKAQVRP